jgi:hypothetical protein
MAMQVWATTFSFLTPSDCIHMDEFYKYLFGEGLLVGEFSEHFVVERRR